MEKGIVVVILQIRETQKGIPVSEYAVHHRVHLDLDLIDCDGLAHPDVIKDIFYGIRDIGLYLFCPR